MRSLLAAYKLVWKRRRLRLRAFRSRHQLTLVKRPTSEVDKDAIQAFVCLRNEMLRLPHFLDHHRRLGVGHFHVVDNDSTDGSYDFLADQPDVTLWHTKESYRASRFGLDWINWLMSRHGHKRWCVLLDVDELLIYPDHERQNLQALTQWLEARGQHAYGALMLDLYPKGPLGAAETAADPLDILTGFDAGPYSAVRQEPLGNLWVQGGPRARVFFNQNRRRAPTLNKLPLVRWHRRYAFVNSAHSMLPRQLNYTYDGPGSAMPSGVLLHTKFLQDVVDRADEDLHRRQHFNEPDAFVRYYEEIKSAPSLWYEDSKTYRGWPQLVELGLMTDDGFAKPQPARPLD